MAFAEVSDVEARYRALTPEEATRAQALLGDAELALRAEFPSLPDQPTGELASALTAVSARMVIRVLRNPGGFRSETAGEFSYTRERGGSSTGELEVTDADRALIGAVLAGPGGSDAFSITPAQ